MSATTQEQARELVTSAFGFVPNLMSAMIEGNPDVAAAYLAASDVMSKSVLTAQEQQIVMLAASAYNDCHYCTAAHRTAGKAMGVTQEDLDAINTLRLPQDPRLKALVEATWALQEQGGWVSESSLSVTREELFALVALVGLKTITNFINHIVGTEVDAPFQAQATRARPQAA